MTSPTLSFDGTDDYIDFGSYIPDSGATARSCTAWVKMPSTDSSQNTIMEWGADNTGERWQWRVVPSGEQRLEINGGGFVSNTNVKDDSWHHLALTYDGSGTLSGVTFYVDGVADGSGSTSDAINTGTENGLEVGRASINSAFFNGALDGPRIYGRELNSSEVQTLYNNAPIDVGIFYAPLNEGSGTVASDATGSNHNGTINGATWSSRSGGTTYDWQTNTDWDSRQSQTNVVHNENLKLGIDGDTYVEIGQQTGQFNGAKEAYYSISSLDSTTVYDNTAENNNSTAVSGTTKVEENNTRFPQSLSFDGTDDYVKLPTAIQDTTSVVGTELWFYPRSTGVQYLLYFHDFYGLLFDQSGNQQITVNTFGDGASLGPTNIALDTWHHCNFYWDIGTEYGISIDGGTWDTYATTHTPSNQSDVSYLGVNGFNATAYFDGKLTELRFVADQRINRADSFYQDQGNLVTARKS